MRFLIDAQLPPALAAQLREIGHDARHVNMIGLGSAADMLIWNHAASEGEVLLTKDEDFAELSRRDPGGPAIVWIRIGNTTSTALWRALEPILPEIVEALSRGERLVEVR